MKAITVIITAASLYVGSCFAQGSSVVLYTRTDVRDLVRSVERHTDDFKKHFDKAVDQTPLNSTKQEDRLWTWTKDLEQSADRLRDDYEHDRIPNMESRVNTLLAVAAGINREMLYRHFDSATDRDWALIRSELNALAVSYGLPTLQSYRVGGYVR